MTQMRRNPGCRTNQTGVTQPFARDQLVEVDFVELESELGAAVEAGLLSEALLSAVLLSPAGAAFAESAPVFDSAEASDDGALFDA
ncbi:MAG TPA: hypothetical protein VGR47_19785 [Terracidiphilus sp.]|nr:hypothetical protein [Terracidiphilus sp.]